MLISRFKLEIGNIYVCEKDKKNKTIKGIGNPVRQHVYVWGVMGHINETPLTSNSSTKYINDYNNH